MSNKIAWQDFTVAGGAIARNPAGQLEARLELAEGYTLTFLADATGITLGWRPDEPVFEATRLEDPDDDAGDVHNGEQIDLWTWRQLPAQQRKHMIVVTDGEAIVARRHEISQSMAQYVPADNWQDLAEQARTAVLAQGGLLHQEGPYQCPPELAELGRWELPPAPLADDEADL